MPAPKVATAPVQSNAFIRQLASSDRQIRTRALESLRIYLRRPTTFTQLDALKLWKGLFYCMFMCDKARNQQRLARELAGLVGELRSRDNVLVFLWGFWATMAREWSAVDSLRVDKFLYLVRCYVRAGLETCASQVRGVAWPDYAEILTGVGGPLSARDAKVPDGLRLHVLDVWVDELEQIEIQDAMTAEEAMAPIQRLRKESLSKSVRERALRVWEDQRWRGEGEGVSEDGSQHEDPTSRDIEQIGEDNDFEGFED